MAESPLIEKRSKCARRAAFFLRGLAIGYFIAACYVITLYLTFSPGTYSNIFRLLIAMIIAMIVIPGWVIAAKLLTIAKRILKQEDTAPRDAKAILISVGIVCSLPLAALGASFLNHALFLFFHRELDKPLYAAAFFLFLILLLHGLAFLAVRDVARSNHSAPKV